VRKPAGFDLISECARQTPAYGGDTAVHTQSLRGQRNAPGVANRRQYADPRIHWPGEAPVRLCSGHDGLGFQPRAQWS